MRYRSLYYRTTLQVKYMTDTQGQLMQDLLTRDLMQWSQGEIDGFIVDAYLSLEASMKGELHTVGGRLVEPVMGKWGSYKYRDDKVCQACVAGAFFVKKTGHLICNNDTSECSTDYITDNNKWPLPYEYGIKSMSVVTFLDGLRYLEGDTKDGEGIRETLSNMGYSAAIVTDEGHVATTIREGVQSSCAEKAEDVLGVLRRFIDNNVSLLTLCSVKQTEYKATIAQ